jgi:cob(I)alamin adenosyltransferase
MKSDETNQTTAPLQVDPQTQIDNFNTPEAQAAREFILSRHRPKGLVIVHTGDGKGKTTAAVGMLVRAAGRHMKVGGLQFLKSEDVSYGELEALRQLGIDIRPMGDGCVWQSRNLAATRALAQHTWEIAQQEIESGRYDMFLMDEFTYVLSFKWLKVEEVVAWLREHKPPLLHLIITGREAPRALIDYADLVTDMTPVKHPFKDQGILAQPGVEF